MNAGATGEIRDGRRVAVRLLALGVAAVVTTGTLGACQTALFPTDESRTQFDRYDRSRDEHAPAFIEDEFGRQRPNLRGRLAPKR